VSSGSFGKVAFRYYVHSKHCATMSEIGTIEGALYHDFQELDKDDIQLPLAPSSMKEVRGRDMCCMGAWERLI
jgi:hypothetical protein